MTITRLTPISDLSALQERLNTIFSDFARPAADESRNAGALQGSSFVPAVDIYEDAQKLALQIEVPGMRPEDIDLQIENNVLTVRGQRTFAADAKEENYHRIERRYGSFTRTFTLPQTVDAENVTAGYEHGVLNIELAKKPEAKPKQIKVAVNGVQSSRQMESSHSN